MDIIRGGSRPSGKGPADWFTGTVRIDPLFTAPEPARVAAPRHLRARCPHRLAHAPARPVAHRAHRVSGACSARAAGRGDPPRRRRLVPARREALARCLAHDGDDPHRHSGIARRQGGRVDGACHRRAVPRLARQRRRTPMRATVMYKAGDVRIETVPDAAIVEPTDALITRHPRLHLRQRPLALHPQATTAGRSAWATRRSASSRTSGPRSRP